MEKSDKEKVKEQFPDAYATWGVKLFSSARQWRIEKGDGTTIASRCRSEKAAWSQAVKNIESKNKSHKTQTNEI